MSSPTALPVRAWPGAEQGEPPTDPGVSRVFSAMASDITVRVSPDLPDPHAAIDAVQLLFAQVERECTRFAADSPLMRANAAGADWVVVPRLCFDAIAEAIGAYQQTSGLFDPRVVRALTALGYDRSLPFAAANVQLDAPPARAASPRIRRWEPGVDVARQAVRIGADPIDLGGIGKGLALRWAGQLIPDCRYFLIEAGGDCLLAGAGPQGTGWQLGVQDPRGGTRPVAVLNVSDAACATSSVRVRHWTVAGRPVHHLIDPRTGEPAGGGLLSVTVVGADPAQAEVWSKALFVQGDSEIARTATAEDIAALWVSVDGAVRFSDAMAPYVVWRSEL